MDNIKKWLEEAGIHVTKVSGDDSSIYWVFKMSSPDINATETLLNTAIAIIEQAKYKINISGYQDFFYYVSIINPLHAGSAKVLEVVEVSPEDVPEAVSEVIPMLEEDSNIVEEVVEAVGDIVEDVVEEAKEVIEEIKETAEGIMSEAKDLADKLTK